MKLADPSESDPKVRSWVHWAIRRLDSLRSIDWNKLIIDNEISLRIAENSVAPYEIPLDRRLHSSQLLNYQEPYRVLAKAQFKTAVLYQLCKKSKKALTLFNDSIVSFVRSEITGGQLPFVTQQIIAEIYFEEAKINTQNPAKSSDFIKKSKQIILNNVVPGFAKELLLGGHRHEEDQDVEEEFLDVVRVLKNYRIFSLEKFFVTDNYSSDVAKHLATAIDEFLSHREMAWEQGISMQATANQELLSIPKRGTKKDCLESDLAKLSIHKRASNIFKSYEHSSLRHVIGMYMQSDSLLKLILLAASEFFYQYPEITEQIIRTISERHQRDVPEDILHAPKLARDDIEARYSIQPIIDEYSMTTQELHLINLELHKLYKAMGLIKKKPFLNIRFS